MCFATLRVAPTKKKTNRTVVPMWWLTIECLSTMDETIEVQTIWRIIYWSNYTSRKCFATIIIINWFIFIFIFSSFDARPYTCIFGAFYSLSVLSTTAHICTVHSKTFLLLFVSWVVQCDAVGFFINNYWIFYHVI